MKHILSIGILSLCVLLAGLVTGCDKSSAPPEPITAEELPGALEKAFAKSKPEVKDLASQVAAAVKAQDYAKASFAMQALVQSAGMTKEQASVVARGTLCVNNLLQSAQAKGDTKAAETLRVQRINK